MRAEARFPAMGSDVHVIVVGAPVSALDAARDLIAGLERRWSRFLDDSEVTVMNREAGRPVRVSGATLALVERAVEGARITDGRYDPTLLRAIERAGYDRSFELLTDRDVGAPDGLEDPVTVAGYERILVDRAESTVTVPRGVGFDSGGIGKGFAVDLVVEALMLEGAAGACVNVGGDLRVEGTAPSGGPWLAGVEHPTRSRLAARVSLTRGAVATSSRARRAWGPSNDRRHHLIDPATGRPAVTSVVAATAVAAEGWQAEVLAKAAFLAGPVEGPALLESLGAQGLVVDEDGTVHESAGLGAFLGDRSRA
ncbi:MAG: FAD:protein FMN transferase [Actinomycetota bacterium]